MLIIDRKFTELYSHGHGIWVFALSEELDVVFENGQRKDIRTIFEYYVACMNDVMKTHIILTGKHERKRQLGS